MTRPAIDAHQQRWLVSNMSMTKTIAAILMLAALPILAQQRGYPPLPRQPQHEAVIDSITAREIETMAARFFPPVALADGCVTSSTTCNAKAFGRLAPGDCTNSSGAFNDNFTFTGKAGDYITFTARALSPTYTEPTVLIVPPLGDGTKPVLVGGGVGGATAGFLLSSSGQWRLDVTSLDLFATGDYVTSLTCEPDPAPAFPDQCVTQSLLCGQVAAAYLTNQSCRFFGSTDLYLDFEIWAKAGDRLTILLTSTDFEGIFGVIRDNDEGYLATSTRRSATEQFVRFTPLVDGFYFIVVSSQTPRDIGAFAIGVSCVGSGCLSPLIVHQPQNVTVPYGQQATLLPSASGTSLSFDWFAVHDFPVLVGTGASLQTPPVRNGQTYLYTARNQCGSEQSNTFGVGPRISRRRSAAH